MTKKNRKYRKSRIRPTGDTPSANKENSFSNMFCRKGDFQMKTFDAATRSCPSVNKNQKRNTKKEDSELHKQSQGSSGLKKKNAAMLYEQVRKMYYVKPTVLPELRLKYRTVSESSTNSEDSFISFEYEDTCDNARSSNSVKSKKRASNKSGRKISVECEESSSGEELERKKKVRFEDESQLVTVHHIVAWDYAYRAARVSPWMTVALDARRFKQKIQSLEPILSPVLYPQHRAKIYEARIKS